jgi:hypothetical protein
MASFNKEIFGGKAHDVFTTAMKVISPNTEWEFSVTLLDVFHNLCSWVLVECLIRHPISLLLKVKLTNIQFANNVLNSKWFARSKYTSKSYKCKQRIIL